MQSTRLSNRKVYWNNLSLPFFTKKSPFVHIQWTSQILNLLVRRNPLLARVILPLQNTDSLHLYIISILRRHTWPQSPQPLNPNELVWFSNGSKSGKSTGARVYGLKPRLGLIKTLVVRYMQSLGCSGYHFHLVLECQRSLAASSLGNWVTFIWVPSHFSVEDNKRADDKARKGANSNNNPSKPR